MEFLKFKDTKCIYCYSNYVSLSQHFFNNPLIEVITLKPCTYQLKLLQKGFIFNLSIAHCNYDKNSSF